MGKLTGKVAIVAGAGRGIGRATAELFAAEGAKVAVLSLTPANVNAVVAHIQSKGGTALGVVCDLSDGEQIAEAVAKVVQTFGGIDILVNVAFDPTVVHSSILDLSVEQLQRNFDMGPIAYLRTMQACYPYLKASGEGRVINFASLAGILGMSPYGPYNLAKEAIRALTRSAAREWGPDNITVNNLLPVADTWGAGPDTPPPTNALGRFGSPEDDVAPVVLFLASSDSRFITGSSLTPDGGQIIDSAR
ncbi:MULTISPECIES: SDR family NAD(P)-dependent oxidoreductase [Rhizobium]|uniref:NAD(P)-dependent dehydrogenase (Short-subunit alcohol dehydrogenase family) n=1 Tax=Rhizobium tropici TaxID=398 RepID=A0A6P1CF77_RHITR|nr:MULTISPECIES: SDR family oxidoreductase [Rhizobium]AGB70757.1 short-chain dehydrogenase [Rhizobium tropici CIAT 899]MBB4245370.1 NAD(P)-dependent dehydrogenase (short-subunit alcohol dehydrogenase family) [Rhizobium tropici]MBB5596718.1 NAD(P)-dependent dehydrogenase (short-subunit alcohol dehydrogenase family) [Rhizobium tropici]MBB6495710.1 NAD(P)-dependent dehydrogenase (short-subunit alcohol dehydrogenase family) [Rhizobium tropici]NEV15071.1 SDR family oxidoreductase [Rhizobium tropici